MKEIRGCVKEREDDPSVHLAALFFAPHTYAVQGSGELARQ